MSLNVLPAALLALLIATSAGASSVPNMDGVWGGKDAAGHTIGLHFFDSLLVISDNNQVITADWTFVGGSKVGDTWEFPMTVTPLSWSDRRGRPTKFKKRTQIEATLYISREFRFCFSPKGAGGKKFTLKAKEPRCAVVGRAAPKTAKPAPKETEAPPAPAETAKPAPTFNECVAACVRNNQMRAVGPDVIEADCRKECRAE